MTEQIVEKLRLITADSIRKMEEASKAFGPEGAPTLIPFERSLKDLEWARAQLDDAIRSGKLDMLPNARQQGFSDFIDSINSDLALGAEGNDRRQSLAEAIEKLNGAVWDSGIHNLSNELFGYQSKMNSLKEIEVELGEKRSHIDQILVAAENSRKLLDQLTDKLTELEALGKTATAAVKETEEHRAKSEALAQTIQAESASTDVSAQGAAAALGRVQTAEASILSLKSDAEAFVTEIQSYRKSISDTTAAAATLLAATDSTNQETLKELRTLVTKSVKDSSSLHNELLTQGSADLKGLVEKLKKLEVEIEDRLLGATAGSLFHTFDDRRADLASGKDRWLWGTGISIVIGIIWGIVLAFAINKGDELLYLKLAVSIPVAYAIAFCTNQYGRDRRLEEEYAFKSTVSLSLEPYRRLVSTFIDANGSQEERDAYARFILSTIDQIFSSPTDKVFGEANKNAKQNSAKEFGHVIEEGLKPIEHFLGTVEKFRH